MVVAVTVGVAVAVSCCVARWMLMMELGLRLRLWRRGKARDVLEWETLNGSLKRSRGSGIGGRKSGWGTMFGLFKTVGTLLVVDRSWWDGMICHCPSQRATATTATATATPL